MFQVIGFRLQNEEYAVPIVKVREIISMQPVTALPNMPEYFEGMTNIRGSVIPIINLKRLMHLPEKGDPAAKIIVITCGTNTYGVLVDSITGVVSLDEKSVELPERIANSGDTAFIDGIAKLGDRLVIILNTTNLVPQVVRTS